MKHYLIILILFLGILPARADYIATHTFVVDAENTITVVVSGTLDATLDGTTGSLSTPLNINFNIATNNDIGDIRLKAFVVDSTSTKNSAFYCTGSGAVTTQPVHLVLGDYVHPPALSSINDCKQASSDPLNNSNAIAYPGTVSINNTGTVSYNNTDGYFDVNVISGTTDLNLTLSTTPKAGTYDVDSATDQADDYKVEIYLDNIPSA